MLFEKKVDFDEIARLGIEPSYIITRDGDDNPLSRFEDDTWDFSYQQALPLNFSSWFNGEPDELFHEIKYQLKAIWFILMAAPEAQFRDRVKSFSNYFAQIRKVARLAHRTGCSFSNASDSSRFQVAIRQSIANTLDEEDNIYGENYLEVILNKIIFITNNPSTSPVIDISLFRPEDHEEVINLLRQKRYGREKKRTPLIPSRIYADAIKSLSDEIQYVEPYLNDIKAFFDRYYTDPKYFTFNRTGFRNKHRSTNAKSEHFGKTCPDHSPVPRGATFQSKEEAKEESGLSDIFETRCKQTTYLGLLWYLMELQKICGLTCQVFSGMRIHELQVLPYDCVERVYIKGFGYVIVLKTHTSKLNGGEYSQAMLWVTNELGEKAVRIAQAIAECFYMHTRGTASTPDTSKMPLWFSPRNDPNRPLVHYDYPMTIMRSMAEEPPKLVPSLIIEQEDLDELETFDALRDWEFKVGQAWPLATHQLRRALVVYASRSGMVSLPSLGNQLKHLSLGMTALYAENSSFAENFIVDEEGRIPEAHGVVREFREEQTFNMSVSFHEKVMKAQSKLSGGQGKIIQKDKEQNTLPAVMASREATDKAIKEGRIAFRETVVGGCMRKEVCDSYGIDDVVPCVFGCADSIIGGDGGKKLKAYAEDLEWGLDDLDEDSPAYKATKSELERIKIKLLEEEGIEV